MKGKRIWTLRVMLIIALVIILFSHTSTRSVPAWSKEELKVLNELINKNTIHVWSSSSRALPGEDLNASLSGLKKIQLLIISPSKNTIGTYIERELQQVGIEVIDFKTKVINKQIVITDKDTPIFYVKANTYKHPHLQLYSYGCKVGTKTMPIEYYADYKKYIGAKLFQAISRNKAKVFLGWKTVDTKFFCRNHR